MAGNAGPTSPPATTMVKYVNLPVVSAKDFIWGYVKRFLPPSAAEHSFETEVFS
jgi:hypothetical protein